MKNTDYRLLLQHSPFGYAYHRLITDEAGKPIDYFFLEINPAFENLTGLAAQNIIGRTVTEVIPGIASDTVDWIAFHGEVALHGGVKEFEMYSEQLKRWYKGQVFSPEKHHFAVIFVDITTEVEKTAELENFFSVNLDLLCIADTSGRFLKVNKAWETILGYPVHEIQQKSFLDFVHPDDLQPTMDALARLERQEDVPQFVNRYRCRDGAYRIIDWHSRPHGNLIYAAARDVTRQKLLESELTQSHERFRSLVESSPFGMVLASCDGTVLFVNEECTRMLGYTREDIPTMDALWQRTHPKEEDRCLARRLWHSMDSNSASARPCDFLLTTKDGKKRDVEFRIKPIGSEMLVILNDVTERKRTAELLVQSEKMHSVGGLVAGVAHEINNPLGGILQGVQNIYRRLSPDMEANHQSAASAGCTLDNIHAYLRLRKIDRMLEGIQECGQRAADIVTSMLSFSRKSETAFAPQALPALAERAINLTRSDYDLKQNYDFRKVEIIRDYAPDLPPVECSATEIVQVLFNLVRNAAQAIAKQPDRNGIGRITIRLQQEGEWALIVVQDNGPGMDNETRRRAFEPFFTTKPPGEGTGLGLPVSFLIISRNHNGEMFIESAPGQGTSFHIRLPVSHAASMAGGLRNTEQAL